MKKPESVIALLDRLDAVEPTFCTQHGIALPVDKDDWARISKALRAADVWLADCDARRARPCTPLHVSHREANAREAFRKLLEGAP